MILPINTTLHVLVGITHVEDELVKEAHNPLRMGGWTLPTTIKSAFSISYMFGPLKPAVDSVPVQSASYSSHHIGDIPAMREVYLSSHPILTLSLGKFYP